MNRSGQGGAPVQQLAEVARFRIRLVIVLVLVVVIPTVPLIRLVAAPSLVHIGEGEHDLVIPILRSGTKHGHPAGVDTFEPFEAQSVLGVLMVEQVDQSVLSFEMRSEATAYISNGGRINLAGR